MTTNRAWVAPEVLAAALDLAGGDMRRVRIVNATEVVVANGPRDACPLVDVVCSYCARPYRRRSDVKVRGASYCSRACRYGGRYGGRKSPVWFHECLACAKTFAAQDKQTRFCSDACRESALRGRVCVDCEVAVGPWQVRCVECKETYDAKRRETTRAAVKARNKEWRKTPKGREQIRRQRRRRRARERGAQQFEPYTLAQVAERDGFTCWICREPVEDMTLEVPDDLAPTVDHVEALALGGDDTETNVRLAHFICNSTRSDTGYDHIPLAVSVGRRFREWARQ